MIFDRTDAKTRQNVTLGRCLAVGNCAPLVILGLKQKGDTL